MLSEVKLCRVAWHHVGLPSCIKVSREKRHRADVVWESSPHALQGTAEPGPSDSGFGIVLLSVITVYVILPSKIISKMDVLGQSVAKNIYITVFPSINLPSSARTKTDNL